MNEEEKLSTPPVGAGLTCPFCGSFLSLRPPLGFRCSKGHTFTAAEIKVQDQGRRDVQALLGQRRAKLSVLLRLVGKVLEHNRPDLAISFQDDIQRIEDEIRLMEDLLKKQQLAQ